MKVKEFLENFIGLNEIYITDGVNIQRIKREIARSKSLKFKEWTDADIFQWKVVDNKIVITLKTIERKLKYRVVNHQGITILCTANRNEAISVCNNIKSPTFVMNDDNDSIIHENKALRKINKESENG